MEKYWFLAPMLTKAYDFLGFVEYFFLKISTIFPLYGPKNKIDEENYFV